MHITGGHQGYIQCLPQLYKLRIHLLQLRYGMALYFQVEIAENLLIPLSRLLGLLGTSFQQQTGHLTLETGRQSDKAIVILGQQLLINPWFVKVAFQVSLGDQLNQILIASLVSGQKDKMRRASIAGVASLATARSYIYFTADDRINFCLSGCLIEVNDPVHVAMVSDSQAGHAQLPGPGHQVRYAAHAIQQAIFSMHMKVAKHEASQR